MCTSVEYESASQSRLLVEFNLVVWTRSTSHQVKRLSTQFSAHQLAKCCPNSITQLRMTYAATSCPSRAASHFVTYNGFPLDLLYINYMHIVSVRSSFCAMMLFAITNGFMSHGRYYKVYRYQFIIVFKTTYRAHERPTVNGWITAGRAFQPQFVPHHGSEPVSHRQDMPSFPSH